MSWERGQADGGTASQVERGPDVQDNGGGDAPVVGCGRVMTGGRQATWRWSAAQLNALVRLLVMVEPGADEDDSIAALQLRLRHARAAEQHAHELVDRLTVTLFDANADLDELADALGLISPEAVRRRVAHRRRQPRSGR